MKKVNPLNGKINILLFFLLALGLASSCSKKNSATPAPTPTPVYSNDLPTQVTTDTMN